MSDEQSYAKLASGTTTAKTYPPEDDKEEWKDEAAEAGLSLSKYLYNLVQEARFMRHQGQLKLGDRRKVEELQDHLSDLEARQTHEIESEPNAVESELIDEALVLQMISEQYKPLDQIVAEVFESDEFQSRVRRKIESQLYGFGEERRAAFRRGHGWKKIDSEGDR